VLAGVGVFLDCFVRILSCFIMCWFVLIGFGGACQSGWIRMLAKVDGLGLVRPQAALYTKS
jgi:hypothetical protein